MENNMMPPICLKHKTQYGLKQLVLMPPLLDETIPHWFCESCEFEAAAHPSASRFPEGSEL